MEYTRSIPAIVLLLTLPCLVSAQALEWAHSIGGGPFHNQYAYATAIDSEGAVISIGTFVVSTDLDPGPDAFIVTSNGDADVFIQKVDAFGNFLWGGSFGGTSTDWAMGITVDSQDNIVLVGRTSGTVDLDPGPGTAFETTPNTVPAAYVIKLGPGGNYLWGHVFGGLGSDAAYDVAIDALDNIITVGALGNGGDLDPGPGVHSVGGFGGNDAFIQKLDANGLFIWGAAIGGTASDIAHGVAVDAAGSVLVTGEFRNTVDFDPGPGTAFRTSGGAEDIFVLKLDAVGSYLWAHAFGSSGSERGRAIAVGPDGGPVLTGRITSPTDFDPGPDTFELPGSNLEEAFICKLSDSGDLVFAFLLASFLNEGRDIFVDQENHVYATGIFSTFSNNPLDLDPGPGEALLFTGVGSNGWVASYDPVGDFRWGFSVGGSNNAVGNGIWVRHPERVALAGQFGQTIDTDPGPNSTILTPSWGADAFVALFDVRDTASVHVRLMALLEGPHASGTMSDQLRTEGLIPLSEPYTDLGLALDQPAITLPGVLNANTHIPIVDWVLVELRDPVDPAIVLARRAALVRANGAVVGTDGLSAVGFGLPPAAYFVALRHRNHLGVMTGSPVALSMHNTHIDLRDPGTPTFGAETRKEVGGNMLLWAGNALVDTQLKYTGLDNDRDAILARIGGTLPTTTVDGYWTEDINMDGTVKYVGSGNDRDFILQNIGGVVPTTVRPEQLP